MFRPQVAAVLGAVLLAPAAARARSVPAPHQQAVRLLSFFLLLKCVLPSVLLSDCRPDSLGLRLGKGGCARLRQVSAQVLDAVRDRVLEPAAEAAHRAARGTSRAGFRVGHWAAAAGAGSQRWAAASVADTRQWASASAAALRQRLDPKARSWAPWTAAGCLE